MTDEEWFEMTDDDERFAARFNVLSEEVEWVLMASRIIADHDDMRLSAVADWDKMAPRALTDRFVNDLSEGEVIALTVPETWLLNVAEVVLEHVSASSRAEIVSVLDSTATALLDAGVRRAFPSGFDFSIDNTGRPDLGKPDQD